MECDVEADGCGEMIVAEWDVGYGSAHECCFFMVVSVL